MKRKIMMLLICGIMGAGMLTGCSSDNGNVNEEVTKEMEEETEVETETESESETESETETESEITEREAENMVLAYAQSYGAILVKAKYNYTDVKNFEAVSCEKGGSVNGGIYSFYVYGSFFGYDEYGTLKEHGKYKWCIGVTADGKVKEGSAPLIQN